MSKKSSANNPRTPVGKKFQRITEASSATPRSVRTDAGRGKNTDVREIVAQNMNEEMLECKMPVFLKEYGAANVTTDMVTACRTYLEDEKHLTHEGTWTAFQTSPGNKEEHENDCYKPLGPIAEAIFDYATTNMKRENNYIFKMLPTAKLRSEIPGSNHLMDACLVEEDQETGSWPNHKLIAPMEAKKADTDDEVREQIVGDCFHILCDDPRRMFIYGMTFTDRWMNVWYFSRSHSVKTYSFNWLEDEGIGYFVHFMLSLALAKPENLGVDPRVHKAPFESSTQQYVYELDFPLENPVPSPDPQKGPRAVLRSDDQRYAEQKALEANGKEKFYFKTLRILSRERPLCITGRMTRVWVVRQVEDVKGTRFLPGSKEVILKDVWIDSSDPTEIQNLEAILIAISKVVDDAKKKYPGPDGIKKFIDDKFSNIENKDEEHENAKARIVNLLTDQNYRSLFLTTLHAWEGKETKLVPEDGVHSPDRPVFSHNSKPGPTGSRAPGTSNPSMASLDNMSKLSILSPRQYAPKRQRRFVFKEVCTTSYDLPTLGDAMDIIHQAFDAIQILYFAGWVHRDISIGNILAVKHTEAGTTKFKVKLSDFEFAQKMGSPKHHSDPRTGTLFFMPVEIMDRHYLVHSIGRHQGTLEHSKANVNLSSMARMLATGRNAADIPSVAEPSWGLPQNHPLLATLNEFVPSADILPVPPNAKAYIPDYKSEVVGYNYQHDIESIWWIIIYFITTLVNHEESHYLAEKWFSYGNVTAERKELVKEAIKSDFGDSLRPELQPFFDLVLEQMRQVLRKEYIKRTLYGQLNDSSSYAYVHAHFARLMSFITLSDDSTWQALEIKKYNPLPESSQVPTAVASGSKRRANDDPFQSSKNKKTKK